MKLYGYTYRAEVFCADTCIVQELLPNTHALIVRGGTTENALDRYASFLGVDRLDEHSFDSDDFPKVILGPEGLTPRDFCARCQRQLLDQ